MIALVRALSGVFGAVLGAFGTMALWAAGHTVATGHTVQPRSNRALTLSAEPVLFGVVVAVMVALGFSFVVTGVRLVLLAWRGR